MYIESGVFPCEATNLPDGATKLSQVLVTGFRDAVGLLGDTAECNLPPSHTSSLQPSGECGQEIGGVRVPVHDARDGALALAFLNQYVQ